MSMLTAYQPGVGRKSWQIEPLVRAFIDPHFDKLIQEGKKGWRIYGALVGRIVWGPLALPVINEA
jgi:hypothetical protein